MSIHVKECFQDYTVIINANLGIFRKSIMKTRIKIINVLNVQMGVRNVKMKEVAKNANLSTFWMMVYVLTLA